MQTIVECVPNFSEGRDRQKVETIIKALLDGPDVYLLDKEMDADHNRSVITVVGTRESVGEAALRGIGKAAELIDLNDHRGGHPRIGATDVVPFVPVSGVTLDDCIRIAGWVAEETWRRFRVPTYLYEAAARSSERRKLENIRRGQFEGLREEISKNPERRPDFGEPALHPTAGATVLGARNFLIAYNINLNTSDVSIAKSIAKKIRASSGGFPCVKAMGVRLQARNLAQVSINLTDFETTPIGVVFDAVARQAADYGLAIQSSEIVGLVPRRALDGAAVQYLKLENFHSDAIFENRLARVLEGRSGLEARPYGRAASLQSTVEQFIEAVAAATPTPGGGSASALAGALAAALGEMVCRITLKRESYAAHHKTLEEFLARLTKIRERLLENIDRDARSYDEVLASLKLPKSTEAERAARSEALERSSKLAATVPLETAELVSETAQIIETLRAITLPQAASDLAVALHLARSAERAALENVRANLSSIRDREWVSQIEAKIQRFETQNAKIETGT